MEHSLVFLVHCADCALQRKIRLDNEKYLKQHPEIAMITSVIISEVLKENPKDPVAFIADYMTEPDLKARVLYAGNLGGVA